MINIKAAAAIPVFLIVGVLAGCASPQVTTSTPAPPMASAVTGASQPEAVSITLSDFSFTPDKIIFQQGKTYRLHLSNASSSSHSFASISFFKAVAIQPQTAGETQTSKIADVIELAPGEQKNLVFVANSPGVYSVECTHFLHSMFGMTGQITIE